MNVIAFQYAQSLWSASDAGLNKIGLRWNAPEYNGARPVTVTRASQAAKMLTEGTCAGRPARLPTVSDQRNLVAVLRKSKQFSGEGQSERG